MAMTTRGYQCSYCKDDAEYMGAAEDGDFYCEDHVHRAPGDVTDIYEDCPDCEGIGSVVAEIDYPEPGHPVTVYDGCDTCGGSGKVEK